MIREVKGYTTDDGRFFETKPEAEYEEAKMELIKEMEAHQITIDALEWIDEITKPLTKYLLAKDNHNASTRSFNSKPKGIRPILDAPFSGKL